MTITETNTPPVLWDILAREMIEHWEGCILHPYHGRADRPDVWTIGWGATSINGTPITPSTPPLSQAEADALLLSDIDTFSEGITCLTPSVPLNPNQQAALTCFVYNVGLGAFASSTIRKDLLAHDFTDAADQFPLWNHANGVVVAPLTTRRRIERMVFLGATFDAALAMA